MLWAVFESVYCQWKINYSLEMMQIVSTYCENLLIEPTTMADVQCI